MVAGELLNGCTPLISRSDINNGISQYVNETPQYSGNCLTIGDTTATCFYQDKSFVTGDHMMMLKAKNKEWDNKYFF